MAAFDISRESRPEMISCRFLRNFSRRMPTGCQPDANGGVVLATSPSSYFLGWPSSSNPPPPPYSRVPKKFAGVIDVSAAKRRALSRVQDRTAIAAQGGQMAAGPGKDQ